VPSKSVSTCTWTGADGKVLSSTVTTIEAVAIAGAACPTPGCDGAVEAWPGISSGYFTGQREYYSTFHVVCSRCKREGFPAFYRGEEHREFALKEGLRQFMLRDNRLHLCIAPA
jgi:hypothetical protein